LLVAAGSGAATFTIPTSNGIPDSYLGETYVLAFNDFEACKKLFAKNGNDIAAVLVEPIPGNMGVIYPHDGFLQGLRSVTKKYQCLLIFDEVITGFRVAWGGAQTLFNISPDITCLGKIIGGGLPVGAYGGRKEIMERVSPLGDMYQAGTLSGNPVAMAAGIATLKELKKRSGYKRLDTMGQQVCEGIRAQAERHGIVVRVEQCGSLFTVFFCDILPSCYEEVKRCDVEAFKRFFQGMLSEGIYLPPSQFEASFISMAHKTKDIEETVQAAGRVFANMGKSGVRNYKPE
jgi:glutamate-1-semialdehyde 2,1-aminomutase